MVKRFLLTFLLVGQAYAQTIRVVTWDMERVRPSAGESPQMRKAARVLQQLEGDVILLQSISGWPACEQLVQSLKPKEYQVVLCSSFGEGETAGLVAVLARVGSRIGWSEAWAGSGGFAFVALPLEDKLVGLISARFPAGRTAPDGGRALRELACRQLIEQIDSMEHWQQNRVDLLIVGGNFRTSPEEDIQEETLSWLEDAGFANAYFTVAREDRLTVRNALGEREQTFDYLFVKNGAFVGAPALLLADGFRHCPVACEVDVKQVSAPTTWVEQVRRAQAEHRLVQARARAAAASAPPELKLPSWPWWAGGVLVVLACGFSLWWWRVSLRLRATEAWALSSSQEPSGFLESHKRVDALPSSENGGPLARSSQADDDDDTEAAAWRARAEAAERRAEHATHLMEKGMLPPLMEWLKHTFLRRLVSQRSDLLESHKRTTDQVRALEEQVARINGGMQSRIKTYERRIKALELELATAQAEKRDLIVAQIRVAREQLEQARQEVS